MTVGFFTAFRVDPQHFLHAAGLVKDVQRIMRSTPVVQLTDRTTPKVPGVDEVRRVDDAPLLEQRLRHYSQCEGPWLLMDTDTSLRADVRPVFFDPNFDIALTDRQWGQNEQQSEETLQTMPFNTGVVFSRSAVFWKDVLQVWYSYPEKARDWLSEQRAVYEVVRTGQYRVKILPGMVYNYPPPSATDIPVVAAVLHYKGIRRKEWLTHKIYAEAAGSR